MSRGSPDALTNWLRLAAVLYIYDRAIRRHMLKTMRQAHGEKAWMDQIVDRMPRDLQHDLRNRIESDDLASAILRQGPCRGDYTAMLNALKATQAQSSTERKSLPR